MLRRPRGALVLALWTLTPWMLAGCRGPSCPAGTLPEPGALAAAAAPDPSLRSLRAEAVVDQRGPEGRIRGQVLMFMQRPDDVRFDAMSQFGPIAILTSHGGRFALSDLKEKRFIEGPACPYNIARMLGVQLTAAEVLGLLLGELPVALPEAHPTQCEEGHLEVHHALAGGGTMIARFVAGPSGQSPRLVGVKRLSSDGAPAWSVRYEGRIESGTASLPRIVERTRNSVSLR